MLLDLLRLKKAGKIFSVFTRSGNILACRSRDSAPIRIASPEALQQLAGSGAARRPVQERAQSGDRSGLPPDSTPERVPGRAAGTGVITPSRHSGSMEVEARSPSGPSRRGSYSHSGPRRAVAAGDVAPAGAARIASGGQLVSSLLDCARGTVETVHLFTTEHYRWYVFNRFSGLARSGERGSGNGSRPITCGASTRCRMIHTGQPESLTKGIVTRGSVHSRSTRQANSLHTPSTRRVRASPISVFGSARI